MGKVIVLRSFESLADATYVKDMLEQNGVESFISNEAMSQLYPFFSSSVHGIPLHILEEDLEKANNILSDLEV